MDGTSVGLWDGSTVDGLTLIGSTDILGLADGLNCVVGSTEYVGYSVGVAMLGISVDGSGVGSLLGLLEGAFDGDLVGELVEGFPEGSKLGKLVGDTDAVSRVFKTVFGKTMKSYSCRYLTSEYILNPMGKASDSEGEVITMNTFRCTLLPSTTAH